MSDDQIEQQIQDKGLTAPRVTPADIEANIVHELYFTAAQAAGLSPVEGIDFIPPRPVGSLDLLTFCVLVLRNGFTVTGESACASPQNFDDEIGRKIARQNAVAKIWPLMGYALKEKLAQTPTDYRQRVITEKAELDANQVKLAAFLSDQSRPELTATEHDRMTRQLTAMAVLSDVLGERISAF